MANPQRKTTFIRKSVCSTPCLFTGRGTFGVTTRETVARGNSSSSLSSSFLRTFPGVTTEANSFKKETEKYRQEYSLYLLRMLQSKMCHEGGREEEVKKCLVTLKKEYEELMKENVSLYELIQKMDSYGKSILMLNNELAKARLLLQVLKENKFDDTLRKVAHHLEGNVNRLKLIGLKQKVFDDAFENNTLGFNSEMYKLLKRMEQYASEHEILMPQLTKEIRNIQTLHHENEELKRRCIELVDQLQTKTIASSYDKYFEMAMEECNDIMLKSSGQKIADLSVSATLQDEMHNFCVPTSSSTPTV